MKKLVALLLALVMVLGLAACGDTDPAGTTDPVDDANSFTFTQYGNARIKIVGSEFFNRDGDDVLRIYYDYTNTEKTLRGHYPSTNLNILSITQDGKECSKYHKMLDWDDAYVPEDDNENLYIQPGCTNRNTLLVQCDPNGGPVKISCYVMVGSWVYNPDEIEAFTFEVDPANLMGAPASFVLPPITDPTYTDSLAASGVYGADEHKISINGVELTKDYDGVDVLRVKLTVTNNAKEAWSPALICDLELYQDGVGLPTAYSSDMDDDNVTAEDEAYREDLEPGETVNCNALYYLRNQNPVEAVAENAGGVTLGACFDVKAMIEAATVAEQAATEGARKALVGTWLQRDSDWEDTYIFNADGTGKLLSNPDYEYPFTYSIKGDTLILDYGDDDEDEFTFSVEGNLLTLIDLWDEKLLLDKKG